MKKLLFIIFALIITASPVLAAKSSNKTIVTTLESESSQSASPLPEPTCDPNASWRNHGTFVSCVAKLHQGGDVVSKAAESNIGKKLESSTSATPSASPSTDPDSTTSAEPESSLSASQPTKQNSTSSILPDIEIMETAYHTADMLATNSFSDEVNLLILTLKSFIISLGNII